MKRSKLRDGIKYAVRILVFIAAFTVGKYVLKADFAPFMQWWLTLAAITITFYPVIGIIFKKFHDGGWMFTKAIGLALSGWLMWLFSSIHLMKFTHINTIIVLAICLIINLVIVYFYKQSTEKSELKKVSLANLYEIDPDKIKSILTVEVMFFVLFLFWTYARGCRPDVSNTESPMDYGLMQAMMRSDYMPAQDLWMSGKAINYYYVGQYMATFLVKMSGVRVNEGYNLALMTVAGMTFTLCYSLIYNVTKVFMADCSLRKRVTSKKPIVIPMKKIRTGWCTISGMLAAIAVTFAANMHYPIYKYIIPWIQKLKNQEVTSYWFPNSTRYIGYNPVKEHDKTIHEFPSYSFILGDLHAHVFNIIFVLSVMGLLFALLLKRKEKMDALRLGTSCKRADLKKEAVQPIILLLGFFIGLFHMTNYWDFPIYIVVCGAIILFSNAVLYQFTFDTIKLTALHAIVIFGLGEIVALPFTINFDKISSRICIANEHTALYQLIILWGLPIILITYFVISRYVDLYKEGYITKKGKDYYNNKRKRTYKDIMCVGPEGEQIVKYSGEKNKLYQFIENLQTADLFIVTIGLCGIGLIILPEVIYVEDIYGGYPRANTMFKLTYQGFIMLGLCMGYIIPRFLRFGKTTMRRIYAGFSLVLLLWTAHYSVTAFNAWFGNILKLENYDGLDGVSSFMKTRNPDDYQMIEWLNKNVEGSPVVLEANGTSYSEYQRISAFTGLPTILGWETHEWLWRSGAQGAYPAVLKERREDVKTIYTSYDKNEVLYYLRKYDVSYIYIGSLERDKFATNNFELLKTMGEIVYDSPTTDTKDYESVLVKVDKSKFQTITDIDESLNDE